MIKISQLNMVKVAAFHDEMEKLGFPGGKLLTTLVTKYLPKVLKFGREGKALKGITGKAALFFEHAGKKGLTGKQALIIANRKVARNWGRYKSGVLPELGNIRKTIANSPKHRAKLSPIKAGRGAVGIEDMALLNANRPKGITNFFQRGVGQIATNFNTIQRKGVRKFLQQDLKLARTYTKEINGVNYRYKRSLIGQVLSAGMGSGIGMGAMGYMAYGTNPRTGKQRNQVARVGLAASDAAAWTLAPAFAGAVAGTRLAGSLTKGIFGKNKNVNLRQQQFNNYNNYY